MEHSPRPESTYRPPWAVVSGKAEKMQDSDKRKDKAGSSRPIAGLPVVRHKVAGIDLGSERHWVCAPTIEGKGSRRGRFRSYHERANPDGEVAQGAQGRIGGDGEHGSLLDRTA